MHKETGIGVLFVNRGELGARVHFPRMMLSIRGPRWTNGQIRIAYVNRIEHVKARRWTPASLRFNCDNTLFVTLSQKRDARRFIYPLGARGIEIFVVVDFSSRTKRRLQQLPGIEWANIESDSSVGRQRLIVRVPDEEILGKLISGEDGLMLGGSLILALKRQIGCERNLDGVARSQLHRIWDEVISSDLGPGWGSEPILRSDIVYMIRSCPAANHDVPDFEYAVCMEYAGLAIDSLRQTVLDCGFAYLEAPMIDDVISNWIGYGELSILQDER